MAMSPGTPCTRRLARAELDAFMKREMPNPRSSVNDRRVERKPCLETTFKHMCVWFAIHHLMCRDSILVHALACVVWFGLAASLFSKQFWK